VEAIEPPAIPANKAGFASDAEGLDVDQTVNIDEAKVEHPKNNFSAKPRRKFAWVFWVIGIVIVSPALLLIALSIISSMPTDIDGPVLVSPSESALTPATNVSKTPAAKSSKAAAAIAAAQAAASWEFTEELQSQGYTQTSDGHGAWLVSPNGASTSGGEGSPCDGFGTCAIIETVGDKATCSVIRINFLYPDAWNQAMNVEFALGSSMFVDSSNIASVECVDK